MRSILVALIVATPAIVGADPSPSTAAVIDLGVVYGATCALHEDHTVSCWGSNQA